MTPIGSTTARRWLDTTMDAQVHNQDQARILFDATPECDSLMEHYAALLRTGVPTETVAELVRLTRQLVVSNRQERACENQLAAELDDLCRVLHDTERNHHHVQTALTVKGIARQLRLPLTVLADPGAHDALTVVNAARVVDDVIRTTPARQLLTESVRNELRPTKFGLLVRLHADHMGVAA